MAKIIVLQRRQVHVVCPCRPHRQGLVADKNTVGVELMTMAARRRQHHELAGGADDEVADRASKPTTVTIVRA
jgi:hypothetical protein